MRKFVGALAAAGVLALAPATASAVNGNGGHGVGNKVKQCTGDSFGQVVSGNQPGFNLGQHQKGAVPPGGAKGYLLAHCNSNNST